MQTIKKLTTQKKYSTVPAGRDTIPVRQIFAGTPGDKLSFKKKKGKRKSSGSPL